jgi:hypothetical protein
MINHLLKDSEHGDPVGRAASRVPRRVLVVFLLVIPLFVLGILGSVWCFETHICMAGHMRHPPYAAWHVCADVAWAGALLLGAVLSLVRVGRNLWWLAVLCVLLVVYRFALGSLGGLLPVPV